MRVSGARSERACVKQKVLNETTGEKKHTTMACEWKEKQLPNTPHTRTTLLLVEPSSHFLPRWVTNRQTSQPAITATLLVEEAEFTWVRSGSE